MKRVLLASAAGAAVLTLMAGCRGTNEDSTETPQPEGERRIDIGGFALEIRCRGSGSPTIVFETGALPFADVFGDLLKETAATWRACSYDRAGTGKSDAGATTRSAAVIASELQRLLEAAGEHGPFVFVSWSAGAQYTLAYAIAYPSRVAGIVFVEPRTPEYQLAMPSPFASEENQALLQQLPAPYRLEVEAWDDNARALADAVVPDVPVVVLTAGSPEARAALSPPTDDYAYWTRTHEELAARFPRGRHIVVPDAEHRVWERNPGAVLDAIRVVAGE
jgi:pimeloyl-ACP methyl ester carboxylesterase